MNCPRCGSQINFNENICKNCGFVINNTFQQGYNQSKKSNNTLVIIVVIIISLVICCGLPVGLLATGIGVIGSNIHNNEYTDESYNVIEQNIDSTYVTLIDNSDIEIRLDYVWVSSDNEPVFTVYIYNYDESLVEVTLTDVTINDKLVNLENNSVIVGSATEIDGYDYTITEDFYVSNFKGKSIDSLGFKILIEYNTGGEVETTEFEINLLGEVAKPIICRDTRNNNDESIEVDDKYYYGNDVVGYIELDGVWATFLDDTGSSLTDNAEQYTDGAHIVTLDMYSGVDAITLGESLYNGLELNSNVKTVEETIKESDDDFSMCQLVVEYADGTLWCVTYTTDKSTNKTLYISYETIYGGEDIKEFISDTYKILESYSN